MAPDRGALQPRGPARSQARSPSAATLRDSGGGGRRGHPSRLSRNGSAAASSRVSRSMGLRAGIRRAPRFRVKLSVRPSKRGLPGPYDDRKSRRADLSLPADGVAASAGEADTEQPTEEGREERSGKLRDRRF